jgi:hypothetical protein
LQLTSLRYDWLKAKKIAVKAINKRKAMIEIPFKTVEIIRIQ